MRCKVNYRGDVKKRLIDLGKTQLWLYDQIKKETGLYCDGSYLRKISNGTEPGTKIVAAIKTILEREERATESEIAEESA